MASLLKWFPLSLMHFPILLCHVSMLYWKNSSGMHFSSVVNTFLMAYMPSKLVPLMIPFELREKKKLTQSKIRWMFLSARNYRMLNSPRPLFFRHTRIFGDSHSNIVLFRVQVTCDHLNCQSTITTHPQPYLLYVDLSPACWRPPPPKSSFTSLHSFSCHSENTYAWHGAMVIHSLKHFK